MLAYSPGTGGKPVTAPVIMLPLFKDSSEFVKWLPQAKGKFVLVSAPQPTCRVALVLGVGERVPGVDGHGGEPRTPPCDRSASRP